MSLRAYQWLGVALFGCMGGCIVAISTGSLKLDFDVFKIMGWVLGIAYLIGGVYLARAERKIPKEELENFDANSNFYPVLTECVIPPAPKMWQQTINTKLPLFALVGLLSISLMGGFYVKTERDREQCYEMIKGIESQLGKSAHAIVAMYLRGDLSEDNNGTFLVKSTEYLFGVSFATCRRRLS